MPHTGRSARQAAGAIRLMGARFSVHYESGTGKGRKLELFLSFCFHAAIRDGLADAIADHTVMQFRNFAAARRHT